MGFWSSVGSFVSGCVSAIGGVISSGFGGLCSGICSMASRIASFVATSCPALSGLLSPILSLGPLGVVVVAAVALIIVSLSAALGVSDPEKGDPEPQELGEIAIQHPEIKPANFNSYAEYIEELKKHRDEFNKEEFEKKSDLERSTALAVGLGIQLKACAEKLKMDIPIDFFVTMAKGGVQPVMVNNLLATMSEKGVKNAGVFQDYINGNKLSEAKTLQMDSVMSEIAVKGGPTVEVILDNIDSGKGMGVYEAALKKNDTEA